MGIVWFSPKKTEGYVIRYYSAHKENFDVWLKNIN